MPIMVWTVLTTSVLGLLATPVITSALIVLFIDRNYGGGFFDPRATAGWFYSHPAVYIMVLPAMGMIGEILPVFSRKPFRVQGVRLRDCGHRRPRVLGGRTACSTTGRSTAVLQPDDVPHRRPDRREDVQLDLHPVARQAQPIDAAALRARLPEHVPDRRHQRRVQRRRPGRLRAPRHVLGGRSPHYVLFGGSVFGVMAGLYYWFPKMTGRMLNEGLGKIQFVLMFIGFLALLRCQLGLAGMPRRIADYASGAGWNDLNIAATVGGFLIATSMVPLLWNVFVSLRGGKPAEATTRGRATPSSGRRLAATAVQLRPSARDSVRAAGVRRPPDRRTGRSRPYPSRRARADAMAIDDGALTTTEHDPVAGLRARRTRRDRATSSSGCCCSSPRR